MTAADRAHLLALAKAATPGPWTPHDGFDQITAGHDTVCYIQPNEGGGIDRAEDVAFIAAANPATIIALLSALEAAEDCIMAIRASPTKARVLRVLAVYDTTRAKGDK